AHLFLSCWAAACSWDQDFAAFDCWNQVATRPQAAEMLPQLRELLPEVPSIFGLFAFLQVAEILVDSEEKRATKAAVYRQMQLRLQASGATCPVCLEELSAERRVFE
ncbi:unnamed protein product, partial [Effrenium voratum]